MDLYPVTLYAAAALKSLESLTSSNPALVPETPAKPNQPHLAARAGAVVGSLALLTGLLRLAAR